MGFQKRVNLQPAPAVAGDFAGTNPRMSVTAPPGGYTAAPDYPAAFGGALTEALIVGRFAWFNYATDDSVVDGQLPAGGLASNYYRPNSVLGFVHREDQTVIVKFLAEDRLGVQQGFPVTGIVRGDVWADFLGATPAAAGKVVYADPVTGKATVDVTGQSLTITGATGAIVAATGVMTIAGSPSGTVAVGQVVTGAGIPAGTFITALISSTGGTGTVQLNQSPAANITAEAITILGKQETRWKLAQPVQGSATFTGQFVGTLNNAASPTLQPDIFLTVTASVTNGPIIPGMLITAAGVPAFAQITGQVSGTAGGDGVYTTNVSLLQGSSESMTGHQGTLGKISTWQA